MADVLAAGWNFAGEVNGMRAYSRERLAACICKWRDFGEPKPAWRLFAGAQTADTLTALARELNFQWDYMQTSGAPPVSILPKD